ncbi:hypothetical protein OV203_34165 [Nannocystis sp. ILAH1]|uniref:hypothetical protein n=1 Tax=Nannocystis sp. ILAH1 TaxID=2996789 RepID=UPI00226DB967|nr:hypothetical protein [Nannocystis sp. ILAH1]MCY0992233.1 hypothetical protein [Nannocystis sp. ILAH1]
MLLRLVLVSTMLPPPPSEAEAVAAFNEGKLELALKLHRERAAAPGVHAPAALYGVHDSLRALYRTTGDVAHLCEALDVASGLLARGGFASEKERASWVELEATDAALVGKVGAKCASPPSEPTPTSEPPPSEPTPTSEPTPMTGPTRTTGRRAEGPAPQPGSKDSTPEPGAKDRPPWRPRGRVIAASVLGGVGVSLLGGMAGALVRRDQAEAELAAIVDGAQGREYTAAERAAAHDADDRYVRLHATWPALLAVGCVSVITSVAVLLAPSRAGSRARARAGGTGFVYSF